MQLSLPKQLLIALCLIHLTINVMWLAQNFAPLPWDQAGHTRIALRMSQYFQHKLPADEHPQLLTISNYYPPLVHIITAQFLTLLGPHIFVASLPVTLFFLLLLYAVFKLNSILFNNEWTGLISAALFSLIPVIYENSRWFLLEIPMLALLTLCYILLKKSNTFSDWKYTFLFSVTAALLLLTKWVGIVFLAIPVGFVLYQAYKQKKDLQLVITNALLGLLIVFLIIFPWYSANFSNLFSTGTQALKGEESDPQQLFSVQNLFFYLYQFMNFQVTLWPALGMICSSFGYFFIKKAPYKLLFASFLGGYYLLFTIIGNKDIRYTLPLLLVVISMASYVGFFVYTKRNYLLLSLLGLSALPLIIYYFILSFGLGHKYQGALNLGPIGWIDYINTTDVVVHHPNRDTTPVKKILSDIDRWRDGKHVYAYIGADQQEVNPPTFDLYQSLGNYTEISLPKLAFDQDHFASEAEMLQFMSQFQFFVLPDASVGTTASRNKVAMEQIRDYILRQNLDRYTILREYPSSGPEGKMVLVVPHEK